MFPNSRAVNFAFYISYPYNQTIIIVQCIRDYFLAFRQFHTFFFSFFLLCLFFFSKFAITGHHLFIKSLLLYMARVVYVTSQIYSKYWAKKRRIYIYICSQILLCKSDWKLFNNFSFRVKRWRDFPFYTSIMWNISSKQIVWSNCKLVAWRCNVGINSLSSAFM